MQHDRRKEGCGQASRRSQRSASNLALLDDAILAFCKTNEILLSTSLDGPADLHNRNRPRPGGNSYELAIKGIKAAQQALGKDRVSALMTTTEPSLDRIEDIIDEYVATPRMMLPSSAGGEAYDVAIATTWHRIRCSRV
jgi:sulfatase maturation enzyme AslB (radical SAM superfamily)